MVQTNNVNINSRKAKDMLVSFAKKEPEVPSITVDGVPISRVTECKVHVLGVEPNDKLVVIVMWIK